jgi:hypothetical protein
MAKLKAEFLHQYYKSNRIPLRTILIANFSILQNAASYVSGIYNSSINNKVVSNLVKAIIGFAKDRSLPRVYRKTLRSWLNKNLEGLNHAITSDNQVYFFIDEFSNFNDVPIGIKAVRLLNKLGYKIMILKNVDSGRPYLSKGFLVKARELARRNVLLFADVVNEKTPLIGIEPSAILSFRDEYPDLLRGEEKQKAKKLAENNIQVFYDEFEKAKLWGKRLSTHFQKTFGENTCFVLVFVSKEYSLKDWTNFEFSIARGEARVRETEFILPVRLDNTLLFGLPEDMAYLDLEAEGVDGIVNAVINKLKD